MTNLYSKAQLMAAAKFIQSYALKHNKSTLKKERIIEAVFEAAEKGIDITDEEQLKKIGRDLIAETRSATDALIEMLCKASGATIMKVEPDTVDILQKCSEYTKIRRRLDRIIDKTWGDSSLSVKDSLALLSKAATLSKEQLSEMMMYTALIPDLMAMLTFKELVNTYATALNLSKATYTARWVKCYNLRAISEGNRALKALEQLDEDTLLYCLSSLYPGKSVDNIVKDDRLKNYNRKEVNADLAYVVELIILTSKDRNTTKYRDIAPFLQFALLGDVKVAVDCYYSIHNEHNSQNKFNDTNDTSIKLVDSTERGREIKHDIPKVAYSLIDGHELKDTPSGQIILDLYPYIQEEKLPPLELLQRAAETFMAYCTYNELLNAMVDSTVWQDMAILCDEATTADLFHDCIISITERMKISTEAPNDRDALRLCNFALAGRYAEIANKPAPRLNDKDKTIVSKHKQWLNLTVVEQDNTDFIFTAETCGYLSDCYRAHKKLEKQARLEQKRKQEEERARQLELQRQQRLEQERQKKIAEILEFRDNCTYRAWYEHFLPVGKSLADKYAKTMEQTIEQYEKEAEHTIAPLRISEITRLYDILDTGDVAGWQAELAKDSNYVVHLLGSEFIENKEMVQRRLIKGFYTNNKGLLREILVAYNSTYWIDLFISEPSKADIELRELAEAYELPLSLLSQYIKSYIISENADYIAQKTVAEFFLADVQAITTSSCDSKTAQYIFEHAQQYIKFGRLHFSDNWIREYADTPFDEFTKKYQEEAKQQGIDITPIYDQIIEYLDYCVLELDRTNAQNKQDTTEIPEIIEPTVVAKNETVIDSIKTRKQITATIIDDTSLITAEYEAYYANQPVFWNPTVEDRTTAPKLSRHALVSLLGGAITLDKLQKTIDKLPSNVLLSDVIYEYSVEELRKFRVKTANRTLDPITKEFKSIPTMCREHGVTRKYYEEQLAAGKSSIQALVMSDNDLKIIAAAYQAQGIKYDKRGNYIIYRGAFAVTVHYTELVKVRQKLGL